MIIVRITHGLGNQLFQYAVGRSLSLKLKTKLHFDTSHFNAKDSRCFGLHHFAFPYKINHKLEKLQNQVFNLHTQPPYQLDKNLSKVTENTYISGFWQNENYFLEYRKTLISDLRIRESVIGHLKHKARYILKENSVCVHIRRGDYLTKEYKKFGVLPLEYYYKGLKIMNNKIGSFRTFFFSDDIDWVRSEFKNVNRSEFVSGSYSKNEIEDFYLMTCCKHHIIANSSFSWWAAWLNENKDKIVIAPKKWFNDDSLNGDNTVPYNWIKL